MRAADPAEVREAHRNLLNRATAGNEPLFDAAVRMPTGAHAQPVTGGDENTYRDFEAMVLQTFIKSMLPTDAQTVFGGGMAGDMWKGMMAEQLGQVLADGGGIGIAKQLAEARGKDENQPVKLTHSGDNRNYATGLMQQIQMQIFRDATNSADQFDVQP